MVTPLDRPAAAAARADGAALAGATRVLAVASPGGEWRPFAVLRLGPETQDQHRVSFDPVLNTLPGLEPYDWVRRLREPAYRAARRTRRPGP